MKKLLDQKYFREVFKDHWYTRPSYKMRQFEIALEIKIPN